MSKNFTAEDLINNLVDELERTQDMMRIMSEGKEIPSDFYEELQNDIYSDLDRFYDNREEIREAMKNIVIEEERKPTFEFINECNPKDFPSEVINIQIASINAEQNCVNLYYNNDINKFISVYSKGMSPSLESATLNPDEVTGRTKKEVYEILADFFNKNADTEVPNDMLRFYTSGGFIIDYTEPSTISYDLKRLKEECEQYIFNGFDKSVLSEGNVVAQIDAIQDLYNLSLDGYYINQPFINALAKHMEYQAIKDYELYKHNWIKKHIDERTKKETIVSYKQSGLGKEMSLMDYVENYGFANGSCYMSFEEFKIAEITEKINNKKHTKTDIDRD